LDLVLEIIYYLIHLDPRSAGRAGDHRFVTAIRLFFFVAMLAAGMSCDRTGERLLHASAAAVLVAFC
jgi:hypothetical protein